MNNQSIELKIAAELSRFEKLELVHSSNEWEEQLMGKIYTSNSKKMQSPISYKLLLFVGLFLLFNISFFLTQIETNSENVNSRNELYNSVSEQFLITPTLSNK